MICAPAGAATTWSGTVRRTRRQSFRGSSPTKRRPPSRSRFRRRSSGAPLSPTCARGGAARRRNVARSCGLIDEPLLQPIYDLASPRLAFGRIALIGDAAFVARPHVAAGVSKAADDAAAFAAALDADGVEAALVRFEAERLPVGYNRIIERARHLGAYLQATQSTEERSRSARHGIPQAVLAETAILDFLHA